MQWITCKRATSMGKDIPIGTRGEGEVPAHLVGKVQTLITATPAEAEKPADEAEPAEAEKPADEAEPAEAEKPADEAEPAEAEKPARRSRN